jgi:hypothetical protein
MLPFYQKYATDDDNRAKRRVIRSLDEAYSNMEEIETSEDGSQEDALLLFGKLETSYMLVTALVKESYIYFYSHNADEDEYEFDDVLGSKLGKLLTTVNEIASLLQQIATSFNFLTKPQVSRLIILDETSNRLLHQLKDLLRRLRPSAVGNDAFQINQIKELMSSIVSTADADTKLLNYYSNNYTPAVTKVKAPAPSETMDGGYQLGLRPSLEGTTLPLRFR